MNKKYKELFTPIKINKMVLKNRIIATPVGDMVEAARGGAAMVITHTLPMDLRNAFWSNEPYAFSKYKVENEKNEINKVHAYGAKCSAELLHCGAVVKVPDGEYALGPCDMINDRGCKVKAMNEEDMQMVIDGYTKMAKEAVELGYDCLFMHFAHGWLPAEFISPLYNHRTDEYGGSIENRAKFPLRILESVRKAVGPDFPIDMRISSVEYVDGSISFEDTLAFIKMAEKYIDSVQISCGLDMGFNYEGNVTMATTIFEPHYINVDYASIVKKHVSIPVYAVGGFSDPDEAEAILQSGKVDMIAIGRQMVADPDWANKLLNGQEKDIRPCLRCLQCYHISTEHRNMGCSVNPRYRRETWIPRDEEINKTDNPKNVVIVGAGPAGIKAALTADKQGHKVTLFEKESEVGGMLRYISKEHYKHDIQRYLNYLKYQLSKSNIDLRLNTETTPEMVRELNPDKLIVAIGSDEVKPRIPGYDNKMVLSSFEAIEHPEMIGDRVVIIGGGTIGAEMALGLSEIEKKKVYCIEATDKVAAKGNMLYRISLNQHIRRTDNLNVLTNALCKKIKEHSVIVEYNSEIKEIECDSVIMAIGVKSKRDIANSFYGITPNTVIVGDCNNVRQIMEATLDGFNAGLNI